MAKVKRSKQYLEMAKTVLRARDSTLAYNLPMLPDDIFGAWWLPSRGGCQGPNVCHMLQDIEPDVIALSLCFEAAMCAAEGN